MKRCNTVENLRLFAKSWNNLDASLVEQVMDSNVQYCSQWAESDVWGKDRFVAYLDEKFNQIKTAMQCELITLSAELAIHPGINNRPCILLKQVSSGGITLVLILLLIKNDKIIRIDSCYISNTSELIMTGECPK
jgi:hypothetical protein